MTLASLIWRTLWVGEAQSRGVGEKDKEAGRGLDALLHSRALAPAAITENQQKWEWSEGYDQVEETGPWIRL